MLVQKSKFQNIYKDYFLWFLLSIRILGLNSQLFFLISLMYFSLLLLKQKKLIIPRIPGLIIYIISIIIATIVGGFFYSFRNIVRDLFYVLPTLVWIFIGVNLATKNRFCEKSLLRVLYLYGGIVSLYCLFSFLNQGLFSMGGFRENFGINVYDVGFIAPILLYETILCKNIIFSKRIDIILIVLMFLQITLSFGRVAMLQPLVELIVLCFLTIYTGKNKSKAIKRVFSLLFVLVIALAISIYFLPSEAMEVFVNKILNSMTEIDSQQSYNSTADAMRNWRGYEIKATLDQFKNSNLLVQLFGHGIGCGIYIQYVPYNWKGVLDGNLMPLAHNGFITVLPKMGLLGMLSLVWLFVGSILLGFKKLIKKVGNNDRWILIIAINCAAIVNTYVVRGPVTQECFLIWAILMGWLIKSPLIKNRKFQKT